MSQEPEKKLTTREKNIVGRRRDIKPDYTSTKTLVFYNATILTLLFYGCYRIAS